MAYSTISKPGLHFNTKLYTGNDAASQSITGVGFQPDFVWLKNRGGTNDHQWQDSVRGKSGSNYYYIQSNNANAQGVQGDNDGVNTFGTDGFTVGYTNSGAWNASSSNYVSWNWKAGNSAGSSNSNGSIASTVSVNTTAGFSLVKFTGTGSNATVGHGLGVKPNVIILKSYENAQQWAAYWSAVGATHYFRFNTSNAATSSSARWNNTEPTTSVFSVSTDGEVNTNNEDQIAYCFADKKGFSKSGSYKGNGSADGTFVYTGFKPAFVILKCSSAVGKWLILDNKRPTSGNNPNNARLFADVNNAESTSSNMADFYSNGFKLRTTDTDHNASGATNVYMAFAEEPLVANVGSSIPATAR